MHIYDYIIIGSGLTGLCIAKKIQRETDNILILESSDQIGGDNRPVNLRGQIIDNGLRFFPGGDFPMKSLSFLSSLLEQPVTTGETFANIVETYEASGFKNFVGFGDKSPEFYDQLAYFLNSEEARLSATPREWTQE